MKSESRTKSSIKNVSFSLTTQAITIILNYICRIIFVKTLSEEYLGVNGLFSNILTIFSLAELGIGSAIVYAMYKPIADNDEKQIKCYMNFYKKCYNIIAIIILIIGLLILPFLDFFIKDDISIQYLNIIYILYLLDSVFSYLFVYKSSILNAMQKNYVCNYYQIIGKITMTIFMSLSLILFKNFLIYLSIQILFKLIINILISKRADKMYPYIKKTENSNLEKNEKKNIFKNVYALFCNQIGNVLINGTDNIIISKYVSLISVGLYSNYCLIISALSTFIGQMFNGIVASVGNLAVNSEKEKTFNLFNNIHFINFLISSFCVIELTCCINSFIEISFGKKYVLDTFTIIIIIINFYLLAMKNVVGTFKYALGIFWDDKYCTIIRAIINLILSIILANIYGISGVFLGTLISDLSTTFWYQPYILFKKGFEERSKKYFFDFIKYSIITIFEILVSLTILHYIHIPNLILMMIIQAIVAFIVFLIFTLLIFRENQGFKFILNTINKIFKKIKL